MRLLGAAHKSQQKCQLAISCVSGDETITVAFNAAEWSREVTIDIADELHRRWVGSTRRPRPCESSWGRSVDAKRELANLPALTI
jgi:hypothetical protein